MDEEKLLDLQVALLLVQAAHSGEPLEALKENLNHHHLAELHCELSSGPGKPRWLLAITDPRATVDKSQSKNSSIKEGSPAVFLAVNALPMGPTGELERTIASYWMGLDNLGANNAEGASIHAACRQCLDVLPLQTLLNLLGQGYRVVTAGWGLGGAIAHALAGRLLLQVREEVELAQKMGINLESLSQTEGKVNSFGFGAPMFADAAMHTALQEHGLASNIHTVLRARDASAHFLTLCSSLASATADAAGAIVRRSSSNLGGQADEGGSGPASGRNAPDHAGGPALSGPHFQAVQKWASSVVEQLEAQHRGKRAAALTTRPIPDNCLVSSSGPQGRHSAPQATLAAAAPGSTGSPQARPAAHQVNFAAGAGDSGPAGGAGVATLGSPGLGRSPPTKSASSKAGPAAAPSSPLRSSVSSKGLSTARTSAPAPSGPTKAGSPAAAGAAKTTAGAAAAAAAGAPASNSRRAALVAAGPGARGAPLGTAATAASPSALGPPWAEALSTLLKQADAAPMPYVPVGSFWVLQPLKPGSGGGASATPAKPAAAAGTKGAGAGLAVEQLVALAAVPAAKAAHLGEEWLSEANKELFERWESGLEDYSKDLMEAFAWVSFRTMVSGESGAIDRKLLVRPLKSVDIL